MRAAIYTRVSSTEQAEDGYSIGAQEEKLSAYCKAKDWAVHKVYCDPGFSGANTKRPAIQQMLADVKAHMIDVVVVYKLDRFTRSQKDCITLLEDILLPNNCDFVSMSENFDTSTPYGRAMIGILSVFAQLERETIRERTVMGRIERAKTGLYSGNANLPIGYDYVDGRLIINEYEAMQVREIFAAYNDGMSIVKILEMLQSSGYNTKHGPWKHINTVKRILVSKLYHGDLKYRGNVYSGQHDSIITKDTYDKAQEVHRLYTESATGHRKTPFMSTHLLTGLLFCGECGARMHAKTLSKKSLPSYVCYSVSRTAKKYLIDENCRAAPVSCSELEEYILSAIGDLNLEKIRELKCRSLDATQDSSKFIALEKQLSDIEKRINKLMDLYMMDGISKDDISKKLNELSSQKEKLEKELSKMKMKNKKSPAKNIVKQVKACDYIMSNGTLQQQKAFLSSLIDSITVYKDEIVIKWTFI